MGELDSLRSIPSKCAVAHCCHSDHPVTSSRNRRIMNSIERNEREKLRGTALTFGRSLQLPGDLRGRTASLLRHPGLAQAFEHVGVVFQPHPGHPVTDIHIK